METLILRGAMPGLRRDATLRSSKKSASALSSRLFRRFATLLDVVNHYDTHFGLLLSEREKDDLVEYLKSL